MTKNHPLHLLGPTSVGKGFMTKLLNQALKIRHGISIGVVCIGDEVRKRFGNDSGFKDTYEPIVAKGDLVSDGEIMPMFDGRLKEVCSEDFVITDGFLRNSAQVAHAEKNRLLEHGSACIIMHASKHTCHKRLAHRKELKPDGSRIDEHAFDKRYHAHQDSIGRIQASLVHTKTAIFHVDANADLEREVFPNVLTFAEFVLFRHFEHDRRNLLEEARPLNRTRYQQLQQQ